MTMQNQQFEYVVPIEHEDFPLSCQLLGVYVHAYRTLALPFTSFTSTDDSPSSGVVIKRKESEISSKVLPVSDKGVDGSSGPSYHPPPH